jgi:hypothetical protein
MGFDETEQGLRGLFLVYGVVVACRNLHIERWIDRLGGGSH